MVFLNSIRALCIFIVLANASIDLRPQSIKNNAETCNKLALDPFFESELVVAKSWRIYYSWNIKMEDKCMDIVFRNATPEIVSRIYSDMYDYLESQPYWDAATLMATMGQSNHELLLFADQGAAGSFVGVPNVVRDGNISPNKNAVSLLQFYLKILLDGKYLVMSDCNIGVSTLSVNRDHKFTRQEIKKVAQGLELGVGYSACASDTLENNEYTSV